MSDTKNKTDLTYNIPLLDYASNEVISHYCEADVKSTFDMCKSIKTRRALLEFFKSKEEEQLRAAIYSPECKEK